MQDAVDQLIDLRVWLIFLIEYFHSQLVGAQTQNGRTFFVDFIRPVLIRDYDKDDLNPATFHWNISVLDLANLRVKLDIHQEDVDDEIVFHYVVDGREALAQVRTKVVIDHNCFQKLQTLLHLMDLSLKQNTASLGSIISRQLRLDLNLQRIYPRRIVYRCLSLKIESVFI